MLRSHCGIQLSAQQKRRARGRTNARPRARAAAQHAGTAGLHISLDGRRHVDGDTCAVAAGAWGKRCRAAAPCGNALRQHFQRVRLRPVRRSLACGGDLQRVRPLLAVCVALRQRSMSQRECALTTAKFHVGAGRRGQAAARVAGWSWAQPTSSARGWALAGATHASASPAGGSKGTASAVASLRPCVDDPRLGPGASRGSAFSEAGWRYACASLTCRRLEGHCERSGFPSAVRGRYAS